MSSRSLRTLARRHLPWLLWLALLMPVAQVAAAWHVLSHERIDEGVDAGGETGGSKALHPSHCDLCLTAATVAGGALPGRSPSLPLAAAPYAAPPADTRGGWLAPAAQAYESRAPPIARY
ncbi:MAG: hypothetical protein J0H00_14265 [Burkholderiales bacterium]|mgnify:CR=1 FL=1|nr:hypothetical protein [Burkholderiales bacterium]